MNIKQLSNWMDWL